MTLEELFAIEYQGLKDENARLEAEMVSVKTTLAIERKDGQKYYDIVKKLIRKIIAPKTIFNKSDDGITITTQLKESEFIEFKSMVMEMYERYNFEKNHPELFKEENNER